MRTRLAVLVFAAATLALPVSGAHAGFFTDVAKGTVKNAARHAKKAAKDAADVGRLVGGCVLRRAAGRVC